MFLPDILQSVNVVHDLPELPDSVFPLVNRVSNLGCNSLKSDDRDNISDSAVQKYDTDAVCTIQLPL